MNTAQIAQEWCPPVLHSSVTKAEQLEQTLWETILEQKGLSMGRGTTRRMGYGAKYFDSAVPFAYGESDRYARQKGENYRRAAEVLALMESGLSMRKAALRLGLSFKRVSRSLKRYRVNFPCPPELHSSEGNEE